MKGVRRQVLLPFIQVHQVAPFDLVSGCIDVHLQLVTLTTRHRNVLIEVSFTFYSYRFTSSWVGEVTLTIRGVYSLLETSAFQ